MSDQPVDETVGLLAVGVITVQQSRILHHAAGLAPGTVTTRYNNVRSVFRAAKRDRIIGTDPTDGISLPRKRRAEAAMRIPAPADIGEIMAEADVSFKPFIALCAFAGPATRRGRGRAGR